jgi:hypothetical protein
VDELDGLHGVPPWPVHHGEIVPPSVSPATDPSSPKAKAQRPWAQTSAHRTHKDRPGRLGPML